MSQKNSIQFISRTYPPTLGGIENQNKAIHDHLSTHFDINAITNKHGKKLLLLFLPYAILRSLFNKTSTITLLGDGVLTIIPWLVKKIKPKKKYICIVHGLDITLPAKIYQKLWVKTFFTSIDHFIAVSHNTKDLLIDKGINSNKITFIPNGFDFSGIRYNPDRNKINSLLNINTKNKILLLTLGRLVKRKGVVWFISNVLPNLPPSFIYVIAGSGTQEEQNIKSIIQTKKLSMQVKYLGKVTELEKQILLSNCDVFIQPNIIVDNDVEGFGISVIEATASNLPVIAANIEGLKDAIHNNQNGWLVKSEDQNEFIEKIQSVSKSPELLHKQGGVFREYSNKMFNWKHIIYKYIEIINKIE